MRSTRVDDESGKYTQIGVVTSLLRNYEMWMDVAIRATEVKTVQAAACDTGASLLGKREQDVIRKHTGHRARQLRPISLELGGRPVFRRFIRSEESEIVPSKGTGESGG